MKFYNIDRNFIVKRVLSLQVSLIDHENCNKIDIFAKEEEEEGQIQFLLVSLFF